MRVFALIDKGVQKGQIRRRRWRRRLKGDEARDSRRKEVENTGKREKGAVFRRDYPL